MRHQFERIAVQSHKESDDVRFEFFRTKLLPRLQESVLPGMLLYVPSYYDYVRVTKLLKQSGVDFAANCEYTSASRVAQARH